MGNSRKPPVIGIPLHLRHDVAPFAKRVLEQQSQAYFHAVERAGGVPVGIPTIDSEAGLRAIFERCDAVLFGGGRDISPGLYHQRARADCNVQGEEPSVDRTELLLMKWCIEEQVPLLALCRGEEMLNVATGGTLWQDLNVQGVTKRNHRLHNYGTLVHDVFVTPGSTLGKTLKLRRLRVNSVHHQAIRDVGDALTVVARSDDGVIEGVELPGHPFAIGMQCHPEALIDRFPWARRLFSAFVAAAADHAARRAPESPPRTL
jgi:putative glutamine amidotransferase